MENKPDCYKCKYRREVAGDAHSSCACRTAKVKGNAYGRKMGWFFHPFNFDPTWLEECDSFQPTQSDSKPTPEEQKGDRK